MNLSVGGAFYLTHALFGSALGFFTFGGPCRVSGMSFSIFCKGTQPRLLVESSVANEFVAEVARRAAKLKVGQPLDRTSDIGALIHAAHLGKVSAYVKGASGQGAEIVTGGERLTGGEFGAGQFLQPTIIDKGMAAAAIRPARRLPNSRNNSTTTRYAPSHRLFLTVSITRLTRAVRS